MAYPLFTSAENILSQDSFMAVSGNPTIINFKSPRSPELTSTAILTASMPRNAQEKTVDNMGVLNFIITIPSQAQCFVAAKLLQRTDVELIGDFFCQKSMG
jgi:hypothetical protein